MRNWKKFEVALFLSEQISSRAGLLSRSLVPLHLQINLAGFLFVSVSTVTFALYGTFSRLIIPKYGSVPVACLVLLTGG